MSWILVVIVVIVTMYIIDTQCWKQWYEKAKSFVVSSEAFASNVTSVTSDRRAWTPPKDETVAASATDKPESNRDVYDGKSYADYIKDMAVSQSVQKNHMNFVNERTNNGSWTGKTFTIDSHDSYDPTPWQGLRRPRAVPIGTPDRVPDVDMSLFANQRTLSW